MLDLRCPASLCCLTLALAPAAVRAADIPKGEVNHYSFDHSRVFPGTVRDYWVYVPKQYAPAKPACVYVSQDGIQFNAPAAFDRLIAAKEMPITIGVFVMHGRVKAPSDKALDRFNRSYEYDGLGDAYARFLLEELLPEVEKKKAGDGRQIRLSHDGNDRAIGGASSGAVCAFTAAWERPDAFRRVFSAIGTYVGLRGGNVYPTLIRKYEPRPIRVFLQDGSNDLNIYGGDWWMANQEMERALRFAGYEVQHKWGTGGHSGQHATQIFPDAMRWLWKDWPAPVKAGRGSQQLQQIVRRGEGWEAVQGRHPGVFELAVNAKGEVFLSDFSRSAIYRVDLAGKASRFSGASETLFGLAFGPDGRLYVAARFARRVLAYDARGEVTVVADGLRPQNLVVRHDGRMYVTAVVPITNPNADRATSEVWYISPKGEKSVVDPILKRATGVTLSPDQSLLYVADGDSHWVYSYQIEPDGSLAHRQRYYHLHVPDTADDSGAEGMCVDRDGRLYVATRMGVQVADQAGRVNCIIPVPHGPPTGLCFGGEHFDTLFVACVDGVYKRKMKVRGANAFEVPIKPRPPQL
jgi:sugar lactone lactonase YvrE/enterochelin esterase-like enzyme